MFISIIFSPLYTQSIEEDLNSKEELNTRKTTLKAQFEQVELEISEVKKRLSAQFKEINVLQKTMTGIENRLEQKRSDRHSLLQQCKVYMSNYCIIIIM